MNNTILLQDCIDEFKNQHSISLSDDDTFEFFSLAQITKKMNITYDEIDNAIVDGNLDGGIDIFMIQIDDNPLTSSDELDQLEFSEASEVKVLIGQCKNVKHFREEVLDKIFITIERIYDLEVDVSTLSSDFNGMLCEKIDLFRKVWRLAARKGSQIHIEYFYSCVANETNESDNFKRKKAQILQKTKKEIGDCETTFNVFSAADMLSFYRSKPEVEIDLKLKDLPLSVNYGGDSIGYIGAVMIPDYLAFVTDSEGIVRENIFEENVRHYQGDVEVNKKIQNTLNNDFEKDFWWLNNGITIIASDVRQHHKELTLKGAQIVNGLQTSYTIGKHYEKKDDDQRSVLVKVIKSNDKDTIDNIISATNRQTAINPALLRATDDIQRKIEMFFESKDFYYDRRKNFYKNQGKPANKIFSIQSTAQAIHAILNFKPDESRSKPTTLIKKQDSYNNIFKDGVKFNVFLNCCLIGRSVNEYIKSKLTQKEEKSLARMFSHHIYRVCPAFILNKSHFSNGDLDDLDLSKLDNSLILESFNFVKESIHKFKEESKTQNINSISKSGKFADFLSKELQKKYSLE